MFPKKLKLPAILTATILATAATTLTIAEVTKDPKAAPAGQPEMKLPPGWTAEDMKACMAAGTPGDQHKYLAQSAGTWAGKNTMWMAPGADPIKTESTSTVTSIMDGRFTKVEASGDMPGMGKFSGLGVYGYDNVAKKFVGTWVDNMGTTMMNGTGELSADGKILTWTNTFTCPITKKPATMRQVETTTGPNAMTLEMFMTEPKSGKEYKMMQIDMTKK
jgi:hypothetical protein